MTKESEIKGFGVDIERLPVNFPTHRHDAAFWEALGRADAREIVSNLAGFFQVLQEWDEEEERAKEKPVAEYPRPLIGLELEKPIISTSGRSCQVLKCGKFG